MRDFKKLVKKLRYCSKPGNCNLQCPRFSFAGDCLGKLTTDAADAIEELLAAVPHWISVEERLPEVGIDVLVTDGSDVCISHQVRYVSPTERFTFWSRDDLDLTHWMPLPEPPKEVEGDA